MYIHGWNGEEAKYERLKLREVVVPVIIVLLFVGLAIWATKAYSEEADTPVFVVATERLQGAYRGAVILATPIGGGHVGVILNRPTAMTLSDLFPDDEPSKKVTDPVRVGGPYENQALFALARTTTKPSSRSLEMMPGIWLVIDSGAIDQIIDKAPDSARYFIGLVVWKQGQLKEEVRHGMFVTKPADPEKVFLPDTTHLHEMLVPKKGQVES